MDPQALPASPNLLAIFSAVIAQQAIGYLVYGPKAMALAWTKAWNLDPKKIDRKDPAPFVLSVVKSAVLAMTLDYLIRHLGWTSALGGLRAALYIWIGFIALGTATHYRFAQISTMALLIDLGHDLAAFGAVGLILGAWR